MPSDIDHLVILAEAFFRSASMSLAKEVTIRIQMFDVDGRELIHKTATIAPATIRIHVED